MQARSTATPDQGYSRDLLLWAERKVSDMIRGSLPPERAALAEQGLPAHVLFMAFDGFAMNHKLNGPSQRTDRIVEMAGLLLAADRHRPAALTRAGER